MVDQPSLKQLDGPTGLVVSQVMHRQPQLMVRIVIATLSNGFEKEVE